MRIVIDKSALFGLSAQRVREFCDGEHAAISAHADLLLTRDRGLAESFRIMAPEVRCEEQL